ncbi:hypothetical protein NLG97_g10561 [Lecanicillium saksenae]|uniref:Uncharacterized protein n=1 Tax=Lecanicillium saksenae TaxID=468837 RepID=A0ACC1QCU6_9HYPO|nr:hypothetical protein NLG97_g10561 [Lecanicillium saksenae]
MHAPHQVDHGQRARRRRQGRGPRDHGLGEELQQVDLAAVRPEPAVVDVDEDAADEDLRAARRRVEARGRRVELVAEDVDRRGAVARPVGVLQAGAGHAVKVDGVVVGLVEQPLALGIEEMYVPEGLRFLSAAEVVEDFIDGQGTRGR